MSPPGLTGPEWSDGLCLGAACSIAQSLSLCLSELDVPAAGCAVSLRFYSVISLGIPPNHRL